MSSKEANVEQIVQMVMARLRERSKANGVSTKGTKARPNGSASELVIVGRLITEYDLAQQLNGEQVVRVSSAAVVTPSARDYLNARGVRIERIDNKTANTDRNAMATLMVGAADTRFEPSGLLTGLVRQGAKIEQLAREALVGVIDALAQRVAHGGERGLLFSERAVLAVCLANRVPGVRAAEVRDPREVPDVLREVGANLLIVNPKRQTAHALLQIVRAYCVMPSAGCPQDFAERLK